MKYILHGSPIQNLKTIGPEKGRFGDKVFGTFSKQHAIRYIADAENGGDSWMRLSGRMFVMNTNPEKLIYTRGSVYKLDPRGFKFDAHKGKQHIWVYSKKGICEAVKEEKFSSVLLAWDKARIYAVPRNVSNRFLKDSDYRNREVERIIEKQKQLITRGAYPADGGGGIRRPL